MIRLSGESTRCGVAFLPLEVSNGPTPSMLVRRPRLLVPKMPQRGLSSL